MTEQGAKYNTGLKTIAGKPTWACSILSSGLGAKRLFFFFFGLKIEKMRSCDKVYRLPRKSKIFAIWIFKENIC